MARYQLLIEYVGTDFRGWQIQKKGSTIQGLIQEKLTKLFKEKIILNGSGRTDTGVHAIEQSGHFDCKNEILDLIKKGAKKLVGTHDYSTFRSSSCHAKSPIKTIKSVKIKSSKNKIEIEFKSQSFLQQQVRSMVGCLKYLGEKKWDLKKFDKVFKSKKRVLCAPPAPPEGLFLARVIY